MNTTQPLYGSPFLSRISASAKRLGADFQFYDQLNGRVAFVQRNSARAYFGAGPIKLWPFNSSLWMSVANDKELTLRILAGHGIPVPKTRIAFANVSPYSHLDHVPSSVHEVVSQLSYPLVIKPNRGRCAEGLSFVYGPSSVADAIAYASAHDNAVLFQELVSGRDFRVLVLDEEPLVLIEREVRAILGDGVKSISQLAPTTSGSGTLDSNTGEHISLQSYLKEIGDEVIQKGAAVEIHPATNLALGGSVLDCQLEVPEQWRDLCVSVSRCIPQRLFALDCRGDPSLTDGLHVLEVNANPGVEFLYACSEKIGNEILDILVDKALVTCSGKGE